MACTAWVGAHLLACTMSGPRMLPGTIAALPVTRRNARLLHPSPLRPLPSSSSSAAAAVPAAAVRTPGPVAMSRGGGPRTCAGPSLTVRHSNSSCVSTAHLCAHPYRVPLQRVAAFVHGVRIAERAVRRSRSEEGSDMVAIVLKHASMSGAFCMAGCSCFL